MSFDWSRSLVSQRRSDGETPVGINVAVAAAGVVGGLLAGALVPATVPACRVVPVAAALAVSAAMTADPLALAFGTVIAYLGVTGFLVNRFGELSRHGMPDLMRLVAFVLSGATGLVAGSGLRRVRGSRPAAVPGQVADRGQARRGAAGRIQEVKMEVGRG